MKIIKITLAKETVEAADSADFAQILRDFRKCGLSGFKVPKIKGKEHSKFLAVYNGKKIYFIMVHGNTKPKICLKTPGKEQYRYDTVIKQTSKLDTFLKAFLKHPVSKPYRDKINEFLG